MTACRISGANSAKLRLERTSRTVSLFGFCRIGRNKAGAGSSVMEEYLPSATKPTISVSFPGPVGKRLPTTSSVPKSRLANVRFTIATFGELAPSSCENVRPASNGVPTVRK